MRIVLLGAPGSGKSTQAKRIAKHYNLLYIHDVAKMAKTDAGQLVSDDEIMEALHGYLQEEDVKNGFIFDGFPRNIAQGELLDELLDELDLSLDTCLKVDVDFDSIMQRLSGRYLCKDCGTPYNMYTAPPKMDGCCDECGGDLHHRGEDNEEVIGSRLRIFGAQTEPLLDYYHKQSKKYVIQGLGDVSVVAKAAIKTLDAVARSLIVARASVKSQKKKDEMMGKSSKVNKKSKLGKKAVAKKRAVKKKTVAKKAAKKVVVKATSKKTVAKKAIAKKKSVTKKVVKKKVVAKKKSVAEKSIKKKVVTKKVTSKKKVAVKKTPAKKVASKKKVAVKKTPAKKVASKKKVVAKTKSVKKKSITKKKSKKR